MDISWLIIIFSCRCGEVCVPCKKPCAWQCPHKKCHRQCFEPCDRSLCNEPCPKILPKCQHPCIGLCGEPCPTKCRLCDKNELETLLDDTSTNIESARFVQLEVCLHVFEVSTLDCWMKKSTDQSSCGNCIKVCPSCKDPIYFNPRYNNLISIANKDIENAKRGMAGHDEGQKSRVADMKKALLYLTWQLEADSQHQSWAETKRKWLHSKSCLTPHEHAALEFIISITKKFQEVGCRYR